MKSYEPYYEKYLANQKPNKQQLATKEHFVNWIRSKHRKFRMLNGIHTVDYTYEEKKQVGYSNLASISNLQ